MRIAIFSDIHANLTAFNAVLEDCRQFRIDEMICLGDCIGYGPDPEAVVHKVRTLGIPAIIGNHELALIRPRFLKWFNPAARQSLETHFGLLSESSCAFIRQLPVMESRHGCRFVHGFPPQSATRYLFQVAEDRICRIVDRLSESIFFIGHTHDLRLLDIRKDTVHHLPLKPDETCRLDDGHRYMVNVGSVGQPRDGNPDAKYAIWDTGTRELTIRSIPFDRDAVADRIIALGLPARHAAFYR